MSAPEPNAADDPLADAVARLDRAVSRVGARLEDYRLRLSAAAGDMEAAQELDHDRARLAAALDEARAREAELQAAAEDASQALSDAMADLQALLAASDGSGAQA
jgi:seryl-tRNA synthetase